MDNLITNSSDNTNNIDNIDGTDNEPIDIDQYYPVDADFLMLDEFNIM